ncbi:MULTISPECIES: NAD(P)/FAD-dependent oxidoreductase [unclassified Streptomyces]|uniref:NAD(P)/FAD-dependent oxidoreductase n=1 Tax=unclassified Streptomyces TaxID=2593676 RepID=UPI003661065B
MGMDEDVHDLAAPEAGERITPHRHTGRAARHAVVIGGGIAGLLAAQVLAAHADRVTIVERDRFPDEAKPRSGVPQSGHIHVLLAGGQLALDTLLPGIVAELREHGAPEVGMPGDMVQWQSGIWYRRSPSTTHLLTASRPLLEWLVRRRVLTDTRIGTVQGTEVVGLLGDAVRTTGVLLRERGAGARATREGVVTRALTADLVVDASGRGSRAPDWLAAVGAEPPREETLDSGLAYASRVYRPGGDDGITDSIGYYVVPDPGQVCGGVALPMEDGRYLVTLSGVRGSEPPSNEAEFADFTRRFPHPFLYEWLKRAEPDSPVRAFRNTANVRRRYDRPGRRPAGFLAIGDALCAFNPVYAQGMTVAALNAVALRETLADRRRTPTTRRVQQALLTSARQAWDISSGADKEMPGVVGDAARTRAADRPVAWYLERVQRRAGGNPVVGAAFRAVLHLSAPMNALFAPSVVRAVLFEPVPHTPAEPPMWRESDGPLPDTW